MKESIGYRIKRLRIDSNLTQEEVGKIIGTSKQTLHKYENGIVTNIPSDKIETLANLFDVSPSYIMGWDNNDINDNKLNKEDEKLLNAFNQLNNEGQEKAISYTQDLVDSGKYKKTIKEDTSDYITTIDDMRSYLMTIPMAAFDGKLNPAQMDDEEIQSLYKLLKDND